MLRRKSTLRPLAISLALLLLITSGVYAVEPWSLDLWKDTTTPPTDTTAPSNPSGGLWSEDLWKTPTSPPTTPTNPAPQPTTPTIPSPTKPFDATDILVMQVENNKAIVKGVEKELPVPPTVINGRLMLPLKFIGDALNAKFNGNSLEKKTTIELNGKRIEIWNGKSTAKVNGKEIQLDGSPVVLDGSTLVPAKLVSEYFGYPLEYEPLTKTIILKGDTTATPKPEPEPPKPDPKPETQGSIIESKFNYFGIWELRMDGFAGGMLLGTLIVQEDGTYGMRHAINGTSIGSWRAGTKDEVIGFKDVLILEDGPGGMDWVMVPKKDGLVSVRYHYGYDISTKIWFEDSLGIKVD